MYLQGLNLEAVANIARKLSQSGEMTDPISWEDWNAQLDAPSEEAEQLDAPSEEDEQQRAIALNEIKKLYSDMSSISGERLVNLSVNSQYLFQNILALLKQILDDEPDPLEVRAPRDEEAYYESLDPEMRDFPTMPPEGIPYSS